MIVKEYDERFSFFTREKDIEYLRRAIKVADEAVAGGNNPFGALIVDNEGNILIEQGNIEITTGNCTGPSTKP